MTNHSQVVISIQSAAKPIAIIDKLERYYTCKGILPNFTIQFV